MHFDELLHDGMPMILGRTGCRSSAMMLLIESSDDTMVAC